MKTLKAIITDEVFRVELDKHLKAHNFTKKERNEYVAEALLLPLEQRDALLDAEEQNAKMARKKDIVKSEDEEQIEFVRWFKKEFPGTRILCVWNGGTRSPAERNKQILMGILPGTPDLYVRPWHLWIEMKRSKGGVLSDEQKRFRDECMTEGDFWMIGEGAEDAKSKIMAFLTARVASDDILNK